MCFLHGTLTTHVCLWKGRASAPFSEHQRERTSRTSTRGKVGVHPGSHTGALDTAGMNVKPKSPTFPVVSYLFYNMTAINSLVWPSSKDWEPEATSQEPQCPSNMPPPTTTVTHGTATKQIRFALFCTGLSTAITMPDCSHSLS